MFMFLFTILFLVAGCATGSRYRCVANCPPATKGNNAATLLGMADRKAAQDCAQAIVDYCYQNPQSSVCYAYDGHSGYGYNYNHQYLSRYSRYEQDVLFGHYPGAPVRCPVPTGQ